MILVLVIRRFWAGVDSDFCAAVVVFVAIVFCLYFLVSASVITGAVYCGGVRGVGVVFVVAFIGVDVDDVFVFNLYVLVSASVSASVIVSAVVDDRSASSVILEMVG